MKYVSNIDNTENKANLGVTQDYTNITEPLQDDYSNALEENRIEKNRVEENNIGLASQDDNSSRDIIFETLAEVCGYDWKGVLTKDERGRLNKAVKQLKDIGVGSRRVYPEINKQKIYENSKTHLASKYISDHGLWLPSHMGVSDNHIKIISEKVNEICSN